MLIAADTPFSLFTYTYNLTQPKILNIFRMKYKKLQYKNRKAT